MASAPKGARRSSGFKDGAIVRIALKDFLTYDNVEVRPGPHLNVIIGANATGKSTLVNAICLGLAGHPSILGRAQQPSAFIKHGKEYAVIDIELHNSSGDNYRIRREIYGNGRQSNWVVNSKPTGMKTVTEIMKRLNIQVSNLCQFLPQDRVADFVKMSKQELFENTEKAVDEKLYEMHQKLKKARQRACELQSKCERTTARLDVERQHNTALERDVRNYEERKRFEERIKLLKMKRPWVEYTVWQEHFRAVTNQNQALSRRLDEAKQRKAPTEARLQREQAAYKEKLAVVKSLNSKIISLETSAQAKMQQLEDEEKKVEEMQEHLNAKKREESQRQKKVHDITSQVAALNEELGKTEDPQTLTPLLKVVGDKIVKTTQEMSQSQQQQESTRTDIQMCKNEIRSLEGQLSKIRDIDAQKLEMLRRRDKDTHTAVLWLRANKSRFKTIHEPPIMTLKLKAPDNAKYIESHIPLKDLKMFVCEDADDMEQFFHELRDNQNLCINVALMPKEPPEYFQPKYPIGAFSGFGLTSYLREVFDAPAPVMAYLCRSYFVHAVPIGNDTVNRLTDNITSSFPELRRFYSNDTSYSVKYSKYGNRNKAITAAALRRADILVGNVEVVAEQHLDSQLQTLKEGIGSKEKCLEEMQRTYAELSNSLEALRNEKKDLMNRQHLRQTLEERIRQKQQSLDRLNNVVIDITAEETRVTNEIGKVHDVKLSYLKEMSMYISNSFRFNREKLVLAFGVSFSFKRIKQLEDQLLEDGATILKIERERKVALENLEKIKKQGQQLRMEAEKICPHQRLDGDMKEHFAGLPNTLDEIDATLCDEQARADLIFQVDAEVVRQYNERKVLIDDLDRQQATEREELLTHQHEIDKIKATWKQPILDIVEKVNQCFSQFFMNLGCAGEVALAEPHDPEDYDAYGISIRVKFGDNRPMKDLTTWQSGGERSVSTVLYMLSLQELSSAPFRCVDEINQGMDADNERKVFELVVGAACRESTPQYFLLTPKLLPDLLYTDRMTVLCVHNGPYLMEHENWNIHKFLSRQNSLNKDDTTTKQRQ